MRIALVLMVAVGGCASLEISVPVTGQYGGGIAAIGQATARGDGNGTFWVQAPAGLRCEGTYDSLDTNPSIIVPVKCTGGISGEVVIARRIGRGSGTAIAKLSNGQTGQFVFGDLTFEQAFGSGGKAMLEKN
jgi:hypothetical protein